MNSGIQARNQGWQKVIENCPIDYNVIAQAAVDYLISVGDPFTVEDVRALIPDGVEAHSPNYLPALLGSRARCGHIVPMGRYRTTRRTRNSSKNQVWRAAP